MWLRAEDKASIKPELKTKIIQNNCGKERGGESENYLNKSLLVNFQKSLPFREIYVKYLRKTV